MWRTLIILFLFSGCAEQLTKIELDVSMCDPRTRKDCISVSPEILQIFVNAQEENERLQTALKFCRKRL